MMSAEETRASLLLRLRDSQDQLAWSTFLQIYQPLILRLTCRSGIQEADAREVTQDVLLAVAKSISRWETDPQRGSFRGWLAKTTRNLVVNFLVRQTRHPRGSGDSDVNRWLQQQVDPHSSESTAFRQEEERQIFQWAAEQIRDEFHPSTWQAFWRTAVEGDEVAEVANELGVNAGAIYVSRSRVMKRLREKIQSMEF